MLHEKLPESKRDFALKIIADFRAIFEVVHAHDEAVLLYNDQDWTINFIKEFGKHKLPTITASGKDITFSVVCSNASEKPELSVYALEANNHGTYLFQESSGHNFIIRGISRIISKERNDSEKYSLLESHFILFWDELVNKVKRGNVAYSNFLSQVTS